MIQVAETRADGLAHLGGGVRLVCKGRPHKGGEALRLNLGGSRGACRIREECRGLEGRRANAKAGKCEVARCVRRGSPSLERLEWPPQFRGRAWPGSLGSAVGGLCMSMVIPFPSGLCSLHLRGLLWLGSFFLSFPCFIMLSSTYHLTCSRLVCSLLMSC